ncbi:MAG TPA: hypothetical protein EYG51_16760 [Pseudomonadales bacterium]|nr:hypothetical protein [Pseudomonadales bacterium]
MFNSNRLLRLSGLVSHDEYTSDLLLEEADQVSEGMGGRGIAGGLETISMIVKHLKNKPSKSKMVLDLLTGGDVSAELSRAYSDEEVVEEADYEADEAGEEEDTLAEARVRRVVRKEIIAVLREYRAAVDGGFVRTRFRKGTSAARRWASGQVNTPRNNKNAHRGIGHSRGFGGPGFM